MKSQPLYVLCASYLPKAADSEGPQRARSRDCWPRRAGWSDAPVLGADSPTTTGTQSSQAERVWLYGKGWLGVRSTNNNNGCLQACWNGLVTSLDVVIDVVENILFPLNKNFKSDFGKVNQSVFLKLLSGLKLKNVKERLHKTLFERCNSLHQRHEWDITTLMANLL